LTQNRYKYNLSQVMNQCELNYMMLSRLMPDLSLYQHDRTHNIEDFELQVDHHFVLLFSVIERCKYTTFLRLTINSQTASKHIPEFCIDIRLYHDARLVEIVKESGAAIAPIHPYPNAKMQQMNEKAGQNEFFGEWLSFCLKNGRSTETIRLNNPIVSEE